MPIRYHRWQIVAMKRVIAPQPVEVYFAVYSDTAEEMVLDLMCE